MDLEGKEGEGARKSKHAQAEDALKPGFKPSPAPRTPPRSPQRPRTGARPQRQRWKCLDVPSHSPHCSAEAPQPLGGSRRCRPSAPGAGTSP